MAAVKSWHKHMPRQQTLSCAAHIVCVRCYKWEKEDVGLSVWHDVIVSMLKPMRMSFRCVCMREPVRKSVLVSVWPNHHLLQPGESGPINLQRSPLPHTHSPTSPSLCCDWTRGLLPFDLQHGQQGSFPMPLNWDEGASHLSLSAAGMLAIHQQVADSSMRK